MRALKLGHGDEKARIASRREAAQAFRQSVKVNGDAASMIVPINMERLHEDRARISMDRSRRR